MKATRDPRDVDCWKLIDAKDMAEALIALQEFGFHGTITSEMNVSGRVNYVMAVANETQSQIATLDHVLVWDGRFLAVMPMSSFQSDYTEL